MVGKHPKRTPRAGVDVAGRSPLHYAAAGGAIAEVTRLIEAGADPNAQDDNGWSPLHFAAQASSAEVTRVLIAAGATIDLRDSHGNTPLGRAVFSSRGYGAVIKLLRDAGADPYAENASGVTPLTLARTIANYDVAKFLRLARCTGLSGPAQLRIAITLLLASVTWSAPAQTGQNGKLDDVIAKLRACVRTYAPAAQNSRNAVNFLIETCSAPPGTIDLANPRAPQPGAISLSDLAGVGAIPPGRFRNVIGEEWANFLDQSRPR